MSKHVSQNLTIWKNEVHIYGALKVKFATYVSNFDKDNMAAILKKRANQGIT